MTELQAFMSDESKKGRMIRTARYKYVVFSHGQRPELLFDLETDPGETQNLAYQSAFQEVLLRAPRNVEEGDRRDGGFLLDFQWIRGS